MKSFTESLVQFNSEIELHSLRHRIDEGVFSGLAGMVSGMWGAIRDTSARVTGLFQSGGPEALSQEAGRVQAELNDLGSQVQDDGDQQGQDSWGANWIFGKIQNAASAATGFMSRHPVITKIFVAVVVGGVALQLAKTFGLGSVVAKLVVKARDWLNSKARELGYTNFGAAKEELGGMTAVAGAVGATASGAMNTVVPSAPQAPGASMTKADRPERVPGPFSTLADQPADVAARLRGPAFIADLEADRAAALPVQVDTDPAEGAEEPWRQASRDADQEAQWAKFFQR